jgi:2C-methyl-D-erythritol 2,4-cyclodiphosphate synthase
MKDLYKAFDDSAIMTKIMCNLPTKYDNLMTTWDNVPEDQWKLDNLTLQLLKEETKIKRCKEQDHPTDAKAFVTKAII